MKVIAPQCKFSVFYLMIKFSIDCQKAGFTSYVLIKLEKILLECWLCEPRTRKCGLSCHSTETIKTTL